MWNIGEVHLDEVLGAGMGVCLLEEFLDPACGWLGREPGSFAFYFLPLCVAVLAVFCAVALFDPFFVCDPPF